MGDEARASNISQREKHSRASGHWVLRQDIG